MTRGHYLQQLQDLQDQVLELGAMVSRALERSTDSLRTHDVALARQVVDDDLLINNKRYAIEDAIVHLIATQAPMAQDLRALIAALSIVSDLERIGDHAEGNSRIELMLSDLEERPAEDERLWAMSDMAISMLDRSLQAFVNRDAATAAAICNEDDAVDALYSEHNHQVIARMVKEFPAVVEPLTYHLWVAHNMERICDRVTNICERVIFLVTGQLEEINVSRY